MVTITIKYLGRTKDEFLLVEHQCLESIGAPTAPFWTLPLLDGDAVFVNMAAVCEIRMTKGKISPIAIKS